jgi:hypothetical protein
MAISLSPSILISIGSAMVLEHPHWLRARKIVVSRRNLNDPTVFD